MTEHLRPASRPLEEDLLELSRIFSDIKSTQKDVHLCTRLRLLGQRVPAPFHKYKLAQLEIGKHLDVVLLSPDERSISNVPRDLQEYIWPDLSSGRYNVKDDQLDKLDIPQNLKRRVLRLAHLEQVRVKALSSRDPIDSIIPSPWLVMAGAAVIAFVLSYLPSQKHKQ